MLSRARCHVSRSTEKYSSFPVRSVSRDDRVAKMGLEVLAGLGLRGDVGIRGGRSSRRHDLLERPPTGSSISQH